MNHDRRIDIDRRVPGDRRTSAGYRMYTGPKKDPLSTAEDIAIEDTEIMLRHNVPSPLILYTKIRDE